MNFHLTGDACAVLATARAYAGRDGAAGFLLEYRAMNNVSPRIVLIKKFPTILRARRARLNFTISLFLSFSPSRRARPRFT